MSSPAHSAARPRAASPSPPRSPLLSPRTQSADARRRTGRRLFTFHLANQPDTAPGRRCGACGRMAASARRAARACRIILAAPPLILAPEPSRRWPAPRGNGYRPGALLAPIPQAPSAHNCRRWHGVPRNRRHTPAGPGLRSQAVEGAESTGLAAWSDGRGLGGTHPRPQYLHVFSRPLGKAPAGRAGSGWRPRIHEQDYGYRWQRRRLCSGSRSRRRRTRP